MTKGAGKGSAYERELAKELSLWWSDDRRDDLFWRSSQSGGRATQRAKSGKTTVNACGDLAAQDAEGQKFLDLFTIEIKRGYGTYTVSDIIEGGKNGMNLFVAQAAKAASLAGTPYWLLIHKRDRRPAICLTNGVLPYFVPRSTIDQSELCLDCCLLADFLTPRHREVIVAHDQPK